MRKTRKHTTHVWSTSTHRHGLSGKGNPNGHFSDRRGCKVGTESLSHFMGYRLREGESVHLDGIGYFQVKLNSQEPITSPKLKANQIKLKANICFKADAKLKRSVSVVHVERSKLRNHSASLSNEKIDKLLTNYFNDKPMLTRIDFQRLCGFTSTTAARHIKRLKEEKKLNNIHTYYNPIYVPMPGYYGKTEIKEDETNAIK